MTYFNEEVRKKSYMLEFYSNGIEPDEAVLFSIPPQNENISHPQRINKTNTFGGAVIDDYGNDLFSIRLSGSTVNEEIRLIDYKNLTNSECTGSQEIENLENIIYKYGKLENLKNKKILLYSLDNAKLNNCWNVVIEDFDIKRSTQNPKAYTYEIKCLGYYPKDKKKTLQNDDESSANDIVEQIEDTNKKVEATASNLKGFEKLLNNLAIGSNKLSQGLDKLYSIENKIYEINEMFKNLSDSLTAYTNTISTYVKESVYLGNILISAVVRNTIGFSYNLYESVVSVHNEIMDMCIWARDFADNIENKGFFQAIAGNYIEMFGQTYEEAKDNWMLLISKIENSGNELLVKCDAITRSNETVEVPGDSNTNDRIINVNKYKTYRVKKNDTWESMSLRHYGTATNGKIIAAFNAGTTIEEGEEIKIPVFESVANNYKFYNAADNYGSDISIKNGDFEILNGDIRNTKGIQTLTQAITNRLMTNRDSRIRFAVYGINTQIGKSQLSESYILSSIQETLLADPRIQSVDSISFTGKGDSLNIKVIYTDINGNKNQYGGQI